MVVVVLGPSTYHPNNYKSCECQCILLYVNGINYDSVENTRKLVSKVNACADIKDNCQGMLVTKIFNTTKVC